MIDPRLAELLALLSALLAEEVRAEAAQHRDVAKRSDAERLASRPTSSAAA